MEKNLKIFKKLIDIYITVIFKNKDEKEKFSKKFISLSN